MMKEPKKEDYGWQDATLYGGESDWMLEGGEEEYYKALAEYQGDAPFFCTENADFEKPRCEVQCPFCGNI